MNPFTRSMKRIAFVTAMAVALLALASMAQEPTAAPQRAPVATFTALYSFGTIGGDLDPLNPTYGSFVQGRDGLLYDNSELGSVNGSGTIYSMTTTGTYNIVYAFVNCFSPNTGCLAFGGVTLGNDGNFYGTTNGGGTGPDDGTIYQVTPGGTITVLHDFMGTGDGMHPATAPVQGNDGNFYGTTSPNGDFGVIYKVTPGGVFTTLHVFTNTPDGDGPNGLVLASDGNFYGCTIFGGTNGEGTFFRLTSAGVLTILRHFDLATGGEPQAQLIQGTDGKLYGTTQIGGTSGAGVVFRIATNGSGYTVLHNLNGTTDGSTPFGAPLVQATDGNFYGVASAGGSSGDGTIFKLTSGGAYSTVHNFIGTDGKNPQMGLYQDTNGILYSATVSGGTAAANGGVFYSLNIGAAPFAKLQSTSGTVGSSVALFGQGFTGTTAVSFNGVNASTFSVVSDAYVTATVPTGAKTGTVTVTTPGGPLNSSVAFKVTPKITSLVPAKGAEGAMVSINGTGLTQTTKVTFGGVTATTFTVNSDSKVTATVPSGAKTGKIAVTTAGGTANSSITFRVTPTISSFSPTSGPEGTAVAIAGTGLLQTTAVTFGGVAATSFTANSDTQVTATVPAGAKTGPIVITTPGGTATSSGNFNVTPTITSFSPPSGPEGTSVVIMGTGLLQATGVTFGGVAVSTFTANSDTQVTATVPAGAKTGKIAITTPGGTATSASNFSVTPTITSFTPTHGAVGTIVTITGTGLTQISGVRFGGVAATTFHATSDIQVKATVPTGAVTGMIAVTTPGGTATSTQTFTVN